jgi:ParB family transcriptional regulator, chromosome partitioning protein
MTKPTPDATIRPATKRTFTLIRVDSVDVVTSRNRAAAQLKANIRSIADIGLYKPILVNAIEHAKTGRYQLICGEGRLFAHRELKRDLIKAEIVTVDLATAHLMSLGENLTKSQPKVIEYAQALLEMHERGTSIADLQRITGQSGSYIARYINLMKKGEERLIRGVEQNLFSLDFAMRVAESPDAKFQHILMDAYDKKIVTSKHVELVRKILLERQRQGKNFSSGKKRSPNPLTYSVDDLKRDIDRLTIEKEQAVQATEYKETRLVSLLQVLRFLHEQGPVMDLLRQCQLDTLPALEGTYNG